MASDFLQQLLSRRDTWRGREGANASDSTGHGRGTGFAALDRLLASGGWPDAGLVELLCALPCPPLLSLLLPALARAGNGARVLANPPARPSPASLARAGVPLDQTLIFTSRDRARLLRACFEAAGSDAVSMLVLWAPGGPLPSGTLRRLHLAAQQGRCLLVLARATRAGEQPSPAPLRLRLDCPAPGELDITVHKQPGGQAGQRCRLLLLPTTLRRAPRPCPLQAPVRVPSPAAALPEPLPPPPSSITLPFREPGP